MLHAYIMEIVTAPHLHDPKIRKILHSGARAHLTQPLLDSRLGMRAAGHIFEGSGLHAADDGDCVQWREWGSCGGWAWPSGRPGHQQCKVCKTSGSPISGTEVVMHVRAMLAAWACVWLMLHMSYVHPEHAVLMLPGNTVIEWCTANIPRCPLCCMHWAVVCACTGCTLFLMNATRAHLFYNCTYAPHTGTRVARPSPTSTSASLARCSPRSWPCSSTQQQLPRLVLRLSQVLTA